VVASSTFRMTSLSSDGKDLAAVRFEADFFLVGAFMDAVGFVDLVRFVAIGVTSLRQGSKIVQVPFRVGLECLTEFTTSSLLFGFAQTVEFHLPL